jgi:hypothetical protein
VDTTVGEMKNLRNKVKVTIQNMEGFLEGTCLDEALKKKK